MKTVKTVVAVLAFAVIMLGAGCGGADVRNQTTATTTGQELLDLKKAYDTGVITEKEYERKRDEILDRD